MSLDPQGVVPTDAQHAVVYACHRRDGSRLDAIHEGVVGGLAIIVIVAVALAFGGRASQSTQGAASGASSSCDPQSPRANDPVRVSRVRRHGGRIQRHRRHGRPMSREEFDICAAVLPGRRHDPRGHRKYRNLPVETDADGNVPRADKGASQYHTPHVRLELLRRRAGAPSSAVGGTQTQSGGEASGRLMVLHTPGGGDQVGGRR
mmetsp:Transcript_19398/g.56743  ORF Transcript_19398/g.56743 Transcript_19398/m.56743 type:complete len:205 (+) Transcript_19398:761-1375(+)